METDRSNNGSKMSGTPSNTPGEPKEVIVLPREKKRDPFPEFPAKMLVAIDGWAEIEKAGVGEWLATTLGGVLVDSGRFYRALVGACQACGLDIDDTSTVTDFCRRVTLHTRFARDGGRVQEAQVAINDRWFSKDELMEVAEPTPRMPAFAPLREKVNEVLRACECDRRVVVVGLDIGISVFPDTPYKFFLDSTNEVRHEKELEVLTYPGAGNPERRQQHYCVTRSWNGFKVLMIDTLHISPLDAGPLFLAEAVLRAMESGVYGRKRRTPQSLR